jgi:hypothetical protein
MMNPMTKIDSDDTCPPCGTPSGPIPAGRLGRTALFCLATSRPVAGKLGGAAIRERVVSQPFLGVLLHWPKDMFAVWEAPAKLMLDKRDRFTRPAIEEEFERYLAEKPLLLERSIEFDPDNAGYLTPVFDDRFSVVWYLEDELPIVRAVVPTARFTRGSTGLKSRVEEIVRQASDDRVKLP